MTTTFKHSAELREIKKEASRRCRARAKAIAQGELITPELAIRTNLKKAMRVENFKMVVNGIFVRLSRNGGEKVAMTITGNGQTTRKSYKNINEAVKAFNATVSELA